MIRKLLKFVVRFLLGFIGFVALYMLAALVLSAITSNSSFQPCRDDSVEVFILTNGVHTDLVLPINENNWSQFVDPSATKYNDTAARYVAFGWGDKGFYLETPEWKDLKFSTAFKAMFFLGTSAMHVAFYNEMKEDASCRKICISRHSYQALTDYVRKSFLLVEKRPVLIANASYGQHDIFYEAAGTYNLFFTCNTWANSGLKAAGMKACFWTPFDKGIFAKYPIEGGKR